MRPAVSEIARGRWRGILPLLGIDAKALSGKHGPCPICGGKDRFRFDDKEGRGTWYCSRCGAGDGPKLVMERNGWDFREAARRIEELAGEAPRRDAPAARTEEQNRGACNRLWTRARRVVEGDPVWKWLNRRTGLMTAPACLRYAHSVRQRHEPEVYGPAMLAMVTDADGRPATLHRTYLTEDGQKAPVESPRRIMPGHHPRGSAVRLMTHGSTLGIAEGIETAFAAASLFGVPCWAALNAESLAAWWPPADVREVMIFGDHDLSFTGQAVAFGLARRLAGKNLSTRVEIPPDVGTDWNDVLLRSAKHGPQTEADQALEVAAEAG